MSNFFGAHKKMKRNHVLLRLFATACLVFACASAPLPQTQQPSKKESSDSTANTPPGPGGTSLPNANPFPSTYRPFPSRPTLIRNATIMTAAGPSILNGSVLLRDGKIAADGTGKYVTPGIIDVHSHVGVYPAPGVEANSDGNEATNPVTANVWAEHSVWPQDPQLPRVLAGGVTTMQVLPGSANLIGGRSVVLKVVPSRTVQAMKFPGAKYGLKMACGENPKRVYQTRGPSTRMGNVAGYRAAWIQAETYRRKWDEWNATHKGDPPARDLGLETLAEVLRGNILVHNHCYRADEMAQMLDIAKEFGYQVRAFHHAVEAYKIADLLKASGTGAAEWADWGGFKMESSDSIKANLAITDALGARAMIHSDSADGAQRLNQEVAKAMYAGRSAGLNVTEDQAIRWLTINPAWALALDDKIGSIEAGKNADVVLWSGNPFSIYSKAEKVWIDGAMLFDRDDPKQLWRTDFELGTVREND